MKRHLAHALRRTARKLIGWSNRLDPVTRLGVGELRSNAPGKVIHFEQTAPNKARWIIGRDSGDSGTNMSMTTRSDQ